MKLLNILFFTLMLHAVLYAQDKRNRCGEVFRKEKYPPDSFSIKERIYDLGCTKIIITFLHHDYLGKDSDFCQIWFEQRRDKKIIKSKYWGFEESENGIQLPQKQPLNDYFMINDASEFTGIFT